MAATVQELMTAPVMTVEADEPLSEVAWAMEEKGIKSLAVVDEDVCTPRDMARVVEGNLVPCNGE